MIGDRISFPNHIRGAGLPDVDDVVVHAVHLESRTDEVTKQVFQARAVVKTEKNRTQENGVVFLRACSLKRLPGCKRKAPCRTWNTLTAVPSGTLLQLNEYVESVPRLRYPIHSVHAMTRGSDEVLTARPDRLVFVEV